MIRVVTICSRLRRSCDSIFVNPRFVVDMRRLYRTIAEYDFPGEHLHAEEAVCNVTAGHAEFKSVDSGRARGTNSRGTRSLRSYCDLLNAMVSYKTYLHRHTRVRLCNQELGDRGRDRWGRDRIPLLTARWH
eukprot:3554061-Prymnesium_polylepis.1